MARNSVLRHFKTTRAGFARNGGTCAHNENETNGVGLGQPRPLVLLGQAAWREDAAERAAQGFPRKTHKADGSPAQNGGRRRRPALGGTHPASGKPRRTFPASSANVGRRTRTPKQSSFFIYLSLLIVAHRRGVLVLFAYVCHAFAIAPRRRICYTIRRKDTTVNERMAE